MVEVSLKTTVNASAEELWELLSDFGSLSKFAEAVIKCTVEGEGIGAVRTITLPNGALLTERLEQFDNDGMRLVYSILEGPLPVEGYQATMQVKGLDGNKCELTWSSRFNAKGLPDGEAKAVIEDVYQKGFAGLAKLYG